RLERRARLRRAPPHGDPRPAPARRRRRRASPRILPAEKGVKSPIRASWTRLVSAALLAGGAALFGHGAYIYAKAGLAQVLLRRAWERTLAGERDVKPWPWADTWPVARLTIPKAGTDSIVLAGASGRTLAFGPGHL